MTSRIIRIAILASGLFLGTQAFASAQEVLEKKSFEGVVSYEIRDVQSIETMTVFMKRGRLRLEEREQADGKAVLTDYGLRKSYLIISGREQYIELPLVVIPSKQAASPPRINVQKTDSTDTIEDYECDQFLVTVDTLEYEIWATKGLGTAGSFLTERVSAWMWKILEMGYFPMRFIARDATGEESERFEVASVTKKSLPESLFRIPSGYEKIDPEALQPKQVPKKGKR